MSTGRWLPLVDRFVAESFADDPGGLNLRHLRRTLHWLLELDPGADEAELAKRVRTLVSRHEEGGTDEQNLLRDANSVSFFENNCDYFLQVLVPREGPAAVRAKFAWMFERIGSEPARRIARPWYEAALARLNGLETNR